MGDKVIVDEDEPEIDVEKPPFEIKTVQLRKEVSLLDQFEVLDFLGRGKFGEVKRCRERSTGREFAVKFIATPRPQDRKDVEHEVNMMNRFYHRRLVQLYDAFEAKREMCLILEIIYGGELFDRVISDEFVLTERACVCIMRQVCEGVEYMHSNNIIHLDLKPENILCLSRTSNRVKIIDFGLAREFDPKKDNRVMYGTPEFMAPEVVLYDPIDFSTDMWSIGVMTYVILSGLSPFMGRDDTETLSNVSVGKFDFEPVEFKDISRAAKDFINQLLQAEKRKRMTASMCLKSEWLKNRPTSSSPVLEKSKARLRHYVYRRKWKKAIHAIIALRRMGADLNQLNGNAKLLLQNNYHHLHHKIPARDDAMGRNKNSLGDIGKLSQSSALVRISTESETLPKPVMNGDTNMCKVNHGDKYDYQESNKSSQHKDSRTSERLNHSQLVWSNRVVPETGSNSPGPVQTGSVCTGPQIITEHHRSNQLSSNPQKSNQLGFKHHGINATALNTNSSDFKPRTNANSLSTTADKLLCNNNNYDNQVLITKQRSHGRNVSNPNKLDAYLATSNKCNEFDDRQNVNRTMQGRINSVEATLPSQSTDNFIPQTDSSAIQQVTSENNRIESNRICNKAVKKPDDGHVFNMAAMVAENKKNKEKLEESEDLPEWCKKINSTKKQNGFRDVSSRISDSAYTQIDRRNSPDQYSNHDIQGHKSHPVPECKAPTIQCNGIMKPLVNDNNVWSRDLSVQGHKSHVKPECKAPTTYNNINKPQVTESNGVWKTLRRGFGTSETNLSGVKQCEAKEARKQTTGTEKPAAAPPVKRKLIRERIKFFSRKD